MSYNQWLSLPNEELIVSIETKEEPGIFEVLDLYFPGKTKETILLCPHICHPTQANDGISGALVALFSIYKLSLQFLQSTKYSYRIIMSTEIYGPSAFLHFNSEDIGNFIQAVCLSWCGLKSKPFYSKTRLYNKFDKIVEKVFMDEKMPHTILDFAIRGIGDEFIIDSPGIDIPCSCLQREHPLIEYHTSWDRLDNLSFESIFEVGDILCKAFTIFEQDWIPEREFVGMPCLSNPDINLFLEPDRKPFTTDDGWTYYKRKNYTFMMTFLHDVDGIQSVFDIAQKHSLEFEYVLNYLNKFKEKKLVSEI